MSQSTRPRRSPSVVLLDAMLNLATKVQTGNLPGSGGGGGKRRGRTTLIWLIGGALVVAGGTALLVGVVLRSPGGLADVQPGDVVAAPATSAPAAAPLPVSASSPVATPSSPATS